MTERLTSAFAALAERGTLAGADAVWQRALLAAAVDDRGQLGEGATTPLVPVVRGGVSDAAEWVEVRAADPFAVRRGRARVGLAVGLSAAALIGAGVSAVVLRDGGREGVPGAPGDPDVTAAVPSLPADTTAPPPDDEVTDTTFGGGFTDATSVAEPSPGGHLVGSPCGPSVTAPPATRSTDAPESSAAVTTEFPPTTPGGSLQGGVATCAYPEGALPAVTDGPGSDWVPSATTLPTDAQLVYWRMLEDLDITWRDEGDGTWVYWRTPAGQGAVQDLIAGATVLVIPATDRYIVLARAGTTASGGPGQRPLQVRATLADGSVAVAPLTYDNELSLGHAYLETTLPVMEVSAS